MATLYDTMPSQVGELVLTATDDGLTGVYFETSRHGGPRIAEWQRASAVGAGAAVRAIAAARAQLEEYFAGARTAFELRLAPAGTRFQQRVWLALREIPFGRTTTYSAIARTIGAPDATRAVGAANGRNPLPIIVPCHRVIGADGSLTGFGGGIERKRWLLAHEQPGEEQRSLF